MKSRNTFLFLLFLIIGIQKRKFLNKSGNLSATLEDTIINIGLH